ncbi:hypothetical protein CFP56_025627 [Quercus suber]|uniref:Uncharacterized protein n=1 Tax=Quercus suber TaxID=58331 RepID=A0AAW0K2D3_QUESU
MKPLVNARPTVKVTTECNHWILHKFKTDAAVKATGSIIFGIWDYIRDRFPLIFAKGISLSHGLLKVLFYGHLSVAQLRFPLMPKSEIHKQKQR